MAGRPEAAMSVDYARFFAVLCGGGVEFILVGGRAAVMPKDLEAVAELEALLDESGG